MKFTKEQAIEKIIAKYTAKGEKTDLSRTIKEHVENLMSILGEESEIELDDFVTKVTPFVETALGLSRKVGSDAVQTYKEQHPDKNPPSNEPPKKEPDAKTELEKRLEALERELNENKRRSKIEEVKASLLAKMKELGINDDEWANSFVSEVNVTEDFNVEEKAKSYLNIYNKGKASRSTPTPRSTTRSSEQDADQLKDVAEFLKSRAAERAEIK